MFMKFRTCTFFGVLFYVIKESFTALPFVPFAKLGVGNPPVRPEVCGFLVEPCNFSSVYRRLDGSCTNPYMPSAGMAGAPYLRLIPGYSSDVGKLKKRSRQLTSARKMSEQLFPVGDINSTKGNILSLSFGQVMAHDISLIQDPPKDSKCCTEDRRYQHNMPPSCYPIHIAQGDPMFAAEKIQCQNFTRAQTDRDLGCHKAKGYQISSVSAALDLSIVYGTSTEINHLLRTRQGGLMETQIMDGTEFLPIDDPQVPTCGLAFIAGDYRSDQNPGLLAYQTLFVLEHNRIARVLGGLNPHWSDETLFEESRRILIAQYQYIAYYEWLPMIIAQETLSKTGILYTEAIHVEDFSASVNPGPSNEYAHSAFSYMHSNIPNRFQLVDEDLEVCDEIKWSDTVFCQDYLTVPRTLEKLFQGMAVQPMAETDPIFSEATAHHYDRKKGNLYGNDLRAMGVQRGRDVGLAPYEQYRKFCGAPPSSSFKDFGDVISKINLEHLEKVYNSFEEAELTTAGTVESHIVGSMVGPTYQCILINQFLRTRRGDYLWFEHPAAGFTTKQLESIKTISIAKLLCNSAPGIRRMQPKGFAPPSEENVIVDCSQIKGIDLSLWKMSHRDEAIFSIWKTMWNESLFLDIHTAYDLPFGWLL